MRHVEDAIQRAIVQELRLRGTGALWWHTPNGGKRNMIEAVRFKQLGVLPGVSDLVLITEREKFALELKAPGGRATETQLAFQSEWRERGGHAVIAEGVDEARACLKAWGLLK